MVHEASLCDSTDLEDILINKDREPRSLRLSLLESITDNFSTEIGSGGFAVVYKGLLQNGKVAVKKLDPKLDIDEKKFQQEVDCLLSAKHENIVRFLGYCSDTQGKIWKINEKNVMVDERQRFLCFEYLPSCLDEYIKDPLEGHDWGTCYQIIKGICLGLQYLHQKNIIHLDLKPSNILLDHHMVPKIADFGLSRRFDAKQTHLTATSGLCGTIGYMAPELCYVGKISLKSDIYSLGMIILEILTGRKGHPEADDNVNITERWRMSEGDPLLEYVWKWVDIGVQCIEHIPANRPKVDDIIENFRNMDPNPEAVGSVLDLERMLLDESVEPTKLPLSLLKSITKNFANDHKIGKGEFANVYKGQTQNGTIAVKLLNPTLSKHDPTFPREVDSLMRVKHKNIVRFLGYYFGTGEIEDARRGFSIRKPHRILCFEYLPNGSLDKYISVAYEGLGWMARYQIIRGICNGLHYLHQLNIIHLDLKPSNILLDHNMLPKISDFGLSRRIDTMPNYLVDLRGAVGYMAPEFFDRKVSVKSDIYSLGIMIIEILTGSKGYPGMDNVLESWRFKFGTPMGHKKLEPVQICTEIGIECTDFNPANRPDTRRILERLDAMESKYGIIKTDLSTTSETNVRQYLTHSIL